jgi:pyruvate/2-oxoglutarate dehydrogenase complex dihydrolipoamide dehydrogenase (E3) component
MYPAIRARARQVSEQLRRAALERIRERGVHLVHGTARLDGEHTVAARAADGAETQLRAEYVIVATGPARCGPPASSSSRHSRQEAAR